MSHPCQICGICQQNGISPLLFSPTIKLVCIRFEWSSDRTVDTWLICLWKWSLCLLSACIYLLFIVALIYIIFLTTVRTCYLNMYALCTDRCRYAHIEKHQQPCVTGSLYSCHKPNASAELRSPQLSGLRDRQPDRPSLFPILLSFSFFCFCLQGCVIILSLEYLYVLRVCAGKGCTVGNFSCTESSNWVHQSTFLTFINISSLATVQF